MVYNYPCHLCKGNIKNPALFETKWVLIATSEEILNHSFMVFHKLQNSFQVFTLYIWLIINFIPQYKVICICTPTHVYVLEMLLHFSVQNQTKITGHFSIWDTK